MKKDLIIVLSGVGLVVLLATALTGVLFYKDKLNKDREQARTNATNLETVTIGYDSESLGFYPNIPYEMVSYQNNSHFYEGLTRFDNEYHIRPQLAESWENPTETTWRFRLRKNVTFHDGATMTAADVKASVDMAMANENTSSFLPGLKEVQIVDDHTVDLITSEPAPLLANYLPQVFIMPKTIVDTQAYDVPVGTGPYKYVRTEGKVLTLQRYENYYGVKPKAKNVVLRSYPEPEARIAALKSGEVDIVQTVSDSRNVGSDDKGNKLIGVSIPGIGVSDLILDTVSDKSPNVSGVDTNPFKDLRVRQAIQLALNLDKLITTAGLTDTVPASQVVSPAVFGYDSSIKITKQNLVKAKALMKEAGYESGFTVALDINKSRDKLANAIKDQLAVIGITVTLNLDEADGSFFEKMQKGEMSMFCIEYLAGTGDALEAYDTLYGGENAVYVNAYSSSELKELITKAKGTFDLSKRKEYLLQLAKLADASKADIPLFTAKPSFAYRQGIKVDLRFDGFLTAMDISGAIPVSISKDYDYFGAFKKLFGIAS